MRRLAAYALMICGAGWCQSTDSAVAFEVASIKQSAPPDGRGIRVGCQGGPGRGDPGRITCTNTNLAGMVTMAYSIPYYQLAGLEVADQNRFEITAKLPEGTTKEQLQLMWQNLLAERFKLVVHRERKERQVYELVVAKGGPKLTEAVDEPAPAEGAAPPASEPKPFGALKLDKDGYPDLPPGMSMAIMRGRARWRADKGTTAQLVSLLAGQLGQPVNDATGLAGKYHFNLYWVAESLSARRIGPEGESPLAGASEPEGGPTLFTALQSQLGLKLEQKKGFVEMLVVDHAEKVPTEN